MKRLVDRKYILSSDEIREAVWAWLKSKDIPTPQKPDMLYVSSDDLMPSSVTYCYADEIN